MPKKRDCHCFVPGCSTQYRNSKLSLFGVPKNEEVFRQWEKLIPRADKKLDKYSAVCEKHFNEDFIVKNFVHIINGETVTLPRDRPVLKEDAIPTCFPNLPKYLSKSLPRKRKHRELDENFHTGVPDFNGPQSSLKNITINDLQLVNLPSKFWAKQFPLNENKFLIFHVVNIDLDKTLNVEKLVTLMEKDDHVQGEIYLKGLKVETLPNITSTDMLETILQNTEEVKVCKGAGLASEFESKLEFQKHFIFGNTVYNKKCKRECKETSVCLQCKYLRQLLMHNIARSKRLKLKATCKKYKHKNAKRTFNRLKKRFYSVNEQLSNMQDRNRKLSCIVQKIEQLPAKQQEMVRHCFNASKRKSTNGMTYTNAWILECILMHMRSPKLYEHIRKHKIMILPCRRTVRKYISNYSSGFGFNSKTFEILLEKTKDMEPFLRHGGLLIDEMKLTENLNVNSTGEIEGFVDIGSYTSETMKNRPANHGLLIVYMPLVGDWSQIIGVFSTSNNISGTLLSKLIVEATVLTENAGLFVDFITCDGASWNRSMWNVFGINATSTKITCKVAHPVDFSRYLHFMSDFPHLIKCVRNGFVTNGLLLPEGEARLEHIKAAWKKDCNNVTLKAMPNIRLAHLHPNSFEKMRVNYAFKLFSDEVLKGIYLYKKDVEFQYGSTSATVYFINLMKDLIQIMTARVPREGLRPKSPKQEMLMNFLKYMDKWESFVGSKKNGFLSSSTATGLRVTIQSTLFLLKYLSESKGFQYLLTSRLSQDVIENIFGIIRQSSGCNDHPTAKEFLITVNCLSFYNLAKPPKSGNSPVEIINSCIGAEKCKNSSMVLDLDEVLNVGMISDTQEFTGDVPASPQSQLLVYISGYVGRRCILQSKCEECRSVCLLTTDEDKKKFSGTLIAEFDKGGLLFPSKDLTVFMFQLEHIITNYFKSNDLHRDTIIDILAVLMQNTVRFVGCSEHKKSLSCRIAKFYLLTRLHFYVKGINKTKQESREKAKYLKLRRLK